MEPWVEFSSSMAKPSPCITLRKVERAASEHAPAHTDFRPRSKSTLVPVPLGPEVV
jgi:hypothetical protein